MGCGSNKRTSEPEQKKESPIKKNNFDEEYDLKEALGSGTISEVWSVTHKETKEERAVKIIKKEQDSPVDLSEMIKNETDSLATLESENIVKIYEVFEDEQKYYIVMELLEGPNMGEHLAQTPKTALTEQIVAGWLKQILRGVSHCHEKEIMHRDIRPSNIVFKDKEANIPKLIDFNFSKSYDPDDNCVQDIYATPAYVAPEMLTKKEYSKKTDIWSCGILGYYIIAGKIPYKATKLKDLLVEIKDANFTEQSFAESEWAKVSPECKKFIARMLESDPEKRPNAEELLSDAWLENNNNNPLAVPDQPKEPKDPKTSVEPNSQKAQKFYHASMSYILAIWDNENERKNLEQLFHKMDTNKDRLLNRTELRNALKKTGIVMSPLEFNKMFREIDKDNSGNINFEEYMQATGNNDALINDKPLRAAFNDVAERKDDTINRELLVRLMNEGWMFEAFMDARYKDVNGEIKGDKVYSSL